MIRAIVRSVAASALVLGLAGSVLPALAQGKTIIKLGWTASDGPADPYAVGARAFKEAVEANSKGRIEVRLFPNRQLGDEKPMVEGMRLGTVDAGIITNAVVAQIEPAFQLNDLPFLYADEGQAQRVLDGPIGKKLATKLESKGIKVLGYTEGGFRNMINNVRPVATPEDVKGVKYRVMQNPVFIAMFSSLGGNAVPMAWGETFTAVQQGTIDGLEIPLAVIEQSKYFEVAKYLSLTNHTYSANILMVSKRFFDRLSPDLQKAVTDAGVTATAKQREVAAAHAKEIVAKLEKSGMKVNRIADMAPFRAAVAGVYEQFKPSIGADLLQEALAAVK
ncbi:TRAP transporter substrate-binding protein [Enterovirga rhinocerotis]|uniref:Tripartite ATP-independent transporter DctP family solute receptor n=1 Tax=Enterovirga rhinocerotis TaxID=1339210 RepID=A0A4R7BKX2_9HYPH|nr:TRAP transporter substrate-binding protein [Enterovirga rhinocerotis]TDR84516.1 tripartite ATP-independent transporter DctP family solute receptor [Enterovirga rhinocerotis]